MRLESFSLFVLFSLVVAFLVFSPFSFSPSGFVVHEQYNQFSSSASRFDFDARVISDDLIYDTVYYSVNGSSWQSLSLFGDQYLDSDSWLSSSASFSLPSSLSGSGEHYLLLYSCSLLDGSWDCHGRTAQEIGFWQLTVINNTLQNETLYLVEDGVALADIVVSSDAPSMVRLAAQYFQDDIQAMSGATLPINNNSDMAYDFHVYIGQSQYTDALGITSNECHDGGFRITVMNNSLVLLGEDEPFVDLTIPDDEFDALTSPDYWKNDYSGWRNYHKYYDIWEQDGKGSMNAVHEFLRRQGMRWYYPSDIGTITPSKQSILVQATDEIINPDFALRDPYISYKKFGHLVSSHYPEGSEYGYWEDHLRWILSMGMNERGQYVGGSFGHGLNYVTERDETVVAHPEYYAIWSGNLMNGLDGNDMKQDLCSEELFQATIRYVKDTIDIYNYSTVSIWPADGFARVSESSQECLDMATPERGFYGLISDYVWEFVNNVAWAIHDDPAYGPDKMVLCGAYPSYQLPPLNLSDSRGMAPNIAIVLTKHRTQTADPEMRTFYQNLTEEWLDLLPSKTVYTWDYYTQNHAVRSNIADYPAFYPHIIDEDLKFLSGKISGEFIEVYSNWPPEGFEWDAFAANSLNTYVTTRLYWDVDQDVDALLDEYYELYYGPVKNEMKTLIEYAEENLPYARENPWLLVNMRAMTEEAISIAQVDPDHVYAERIYPLLGLINAYYEGEEILLDSCQDLDSPATTYKLTGDVTAQGSCFLFDADGITLDCQGHTITYSADGINDDDHAITIIEGHPTNTYRGDYFTINNCTIQDGSYLSGNSTGIAIYLKDADHGHITDVFINTSGHGISGRGVNITYIRNEVYAYEGVAYITQYGDSKTLGPITQNVFKDNYFSSVENYGGRFYRNNNDTVVNNTFYSENTVGLHLFANVNMTFINNTFISDSALGFRVYGPESFVEFEDNEQIDG